MSSADPLILETVDSIFSDLCTAEAIREALGSGKPPRELWSAVVDGDFHLVGLPAAVGGGGSLEDAAGILRLLGRHAAPLPLAEIGLLGGWALTGSGLGIPDGIFTFGGCLPADSLAIDLDGPRPLLAGTAHRVPWAGAAERIVALASSRDGPRLVSAPLALAVVSPGSNLAGEPRCRVEFSNIALEDGEMARPGLGASFGSLLARAALSRAMMMAGALERVLELTLEHASTRQQFGRPLNRFQAVTQNLALLAEQSMQASMAAEIGLAGLAEDSDRAMADHAVAKTVVGAAASEGARLAHQLHGAIGTTAEYSLQLFTRRLWAWRDEYGNDRAWSERLGGVMLDNGAAGAWDWCSAAPGGSRAPQLPEEAR
jgi:acyl-CoA dehydrogenase